jgi:hypothetical protein
LNAARSLGKATHIWRGFPLLYIMTIFGIIPLLLDMSSLFTQDSKGFTMLGVFLVFIVASVLGWIIYRWYKGGLVRERVVQNFENREKKQNAMKSLPDDMDYIISELVCLREHNQYFHVF